MRDKELSHREQVINELKELIASRPEVQELPDDFTAQVEDHLRHLHFVLTEVSYHDAKFAQLVSCMEAYELRS